MRLRRFSQKGLWLPPESRECLGGGTVAATLGRLLPRLGILGMKLRNRSDGLTGLEIQPKLLPYSIHSVVFLDLLVLFYFIILCS